MAKLNAPFDPMQHDPSQGGSGLPQLPIGKHPVVITGDEVKANGKNTGGFLELTLHVIDGPSKGQTGVHRLNLYNQSTQAVEIANRQLAALCHVTGQFRLGAGGDDTSVLHNIPFVIEVGLQKDAEAAAKGYTEVKKVYDINGNEPGKQGQQQPQAAAPAQSNGFAQPAANQQFSQPAQTASPASGFSQPQNNAPAWGGGQAAAPAQQPPAAGGWSQNNNNAEQPAGKPAWVR